MEGTLRPPFHNSFLRFDLLPSPKLIPFLLRRSSPLGLPMTGCAFYGIKLSFFSEYPVLDVVEYVSRDLSPVRNRNRQLETE
jgi:hypothetical protein